MGQDTEVVTDDIDDAATIITEAMAVAVIEEASAQNVLTEAKGMKVRTAAAYATAGAFLRDVVMGQIRAKEARFAPFAEAAHRIHRRITTRRNEVLAPLREAERLLKDAMATWYRAEEERRRAEEKRRNDALRKQQEEAERQRMEAERKRQAEMAKNPTAVPPPPPPPPPPPAPATVASRVPQEKGVATRTVWDYRLTDDGQGVGRAYLIPDKAKILRVVLAMGRDAEREIGGITVFEKTTIVTRATR